MPKKVLNISSYSVRDLFNYFVFCCFFSFSIFSVSFDLHTHFWYVLVYHNHSQKKQKDSLDGILDWVLFAAEFDFLKIIVSRLSILSILKLSISTYIKGKHWMCRKIKTIVFFMWPGALIYLILLFWYYFDVFDWLCLG